MEFSKRLTEQARNIIDAAEILARLGNFAYIGTEHILMAIIGQDDSAVADIFKNAGISFDGVRSALYRRGGQMADISSIIDMRKVTGFSDAMSLSLRMAADIANQHNQDYCGVEHLAISILSQKNCRASVLLRELDIDTDKIAQKIGHLINTESNNYNDAAKLNPERKDPSHSTFKKFTINLTDLAKKGKLDPVIGRNKELDRLITIINRRTKNNPILIGEAGVGKTAIVEGLAEKIAAKNVPDFMSDMQILQLDLTALVAGSKYRGEFEDRLKKVIEDIKKQKNSVVFIDEIHLLMGAGSAEGSMDAANILKPALARGEFRLIGATTNDEYRRHIEKDAALTRRLQSIVVNPPSTEDTKRILAGIVSKYENFHQVKINPNILSEAVRLSERYLVERNQPDKAIDVIDETAAQVHIDSVKTKRGEDLGTFKVEQKRLKDELDLAVNDEDYERAALYKMRLSRLKEKIEELEKLSKDAKLSVKLNDIAKTVSLMSGVPLERLERSEANKLINLEKRLQKSVIGQKEAISAIAKAIRHSRAGIAAPNRPIGSFIFLGPTGVGKTELARVLAREVFGSDNNLIKIDMSELSERHNVARLVGAPAGYVGYDDGGQLIKKVRSNPYSVVLFDEIEKAHPDIFNILLQILEDGTLTDGQGKMADFSNCIVILTSNVGANEITKDSLGFKLKDKNHADEKRNRSIIDNKLKELMRPELLNRFDKTILFNKLSKIDVGQIFDILIKDLNNRLATKGVGLTVSAKLKHHLIKLGYSDTYGARPLRRTIEDKLEYLIADEMIKGKIKRGNLIKADLKNNVIAIEQQSEKAVLNKKA